MNELLTRIKAKKKIFDNYQPLPVELIKNLDEWFRVELTYSSNAIEGNTLSRVETALVVEKGLTVEGKTLQEHLEATNHAQALDFVRTLAHKTKQDISEKDLLEIHRIVLQKIDDADAGKYRNVSVRIAGSRAVLPNPLKVPKLMQELIEWLRQTNDHLLRIAADAHFRLVSIHPFTDGNGRTARLLMNLILMQDGYPPAIIRKEDRKNYINAIEKGQLTDDLTDYYNLIYQAVEYSLDIYLDALKPNEEQAKKPKPPKELLKIGELAKMSREGVSTIRFWTKQELLKIASRTRGGYQLYDPQTIETIKKIRSFQKEKRLSIGEIKNILNHNNF